MIDIEWHRRGLQRVAYKADSVNSGCLIIEVHNHRTAAGTSPSSAMNQVGGTKHIPYSVNNYNEHITPSPHVPYPDQKLKSASPSKTLAASSDAMPAPDHPASAMQKKAAKQPTITTVVLFPTPISQHEELALLAKTPYSDRSKRQGSAHPGSKDGATPTLAHPPTPLTSVPPTPLSAKGPGRQPTMVLTGENAHDFEAEIINRTAPPLLLDPAASFAESLEIIETLKHPLHSNKPPEAKSRKRTVAEVAADEELARKEEHFMLSFDERQQSSLTGGPAGTATDGQGGLRGAGTSSFEPTFKRFKLIENIRRDHDEALRTKKEEEARAQQLKRQQQEADKTKKMEMDAKRAETERLMHNRQLQQEQQRQQQEQYRQQQIHQNQQQQQAAQQQQQQAQQAQAQQAAAQAQQAQLQALQASQMSPALRQHPSMSASPVNGTPMTSVAMTSVPMATSASNQAAGSPARPPSTVQHVSNGMGMARQVSQQHNSAHGTPQMHSTPSMTSAQPVTRIMTPQPGVSQQGSPVPSHMRGTPMMMATPTPSHNMTSEQQAQYMQQQQQQQQQRNLLRQQAQLQGTQHMSPQQLAMLGRQQGMGTPTPQGLMTPQTMNRMTMNGGQMQGMNGSSPGGAMMQTPSGLPPQIQMQLQQAVSSVHARVMAQYTKEAEARRVNWVQNIRAQGQTQPTPEQQAQYAQAENSHKQLASDRLNVEKNGLLRQAQQRAQQMQLQMQHQLQQQQGMQQGMQQGIQQGMQQGMPMQPNMQQFSQQQQQALQQRAMQQGNMMGQPGGMPGQMGGMQRAQPSAEYMQQLNQQRNQMQKMAQAQRQVIGQNGMQQPGNMQQMSQQQMMQLHMMRQNQLAQQQQQQQMGGMGMPQQGMPGQGMGM
jgi:transcription factor SPT20